MVRLFISDIDGCLAAPYEPYDLPRLATLADAAAAARPVLSLLSGRAFPYVEAMTQLLRLRAPVAFESGGGVFWREEARIEWNPAFTPDVEAQIADVRAWMHSDLLPALPVHYDYGKRTQAGVVSADTDAVLRAADRIKRHVQQSCPDLVAFQTPISVDVMARAITKAQAVAWLAELTGVPLEETAYIGDTEGDVEALRRVGHAFCPANADRVVREVVNGVTPSPLAEGVLEAYRWCQAAPVSSPPAVAVS